MFGRKPRLKFVQLGLLGGAMCPCGALLLGSGYYEDDVDGYTGVDLLRCWECGKVFTGFPQGKFVAQRYVGVQRVDADGSPHSQLDTPP